MPKSVNPNLFFLSFLSLDSSLLVIKPTTAASSESFMMFFCHMNKYTVICEERKVEGTKHNPLWYTCVNCKGGVYALS